LINALSDFCYIGIREKSGVDLCEISGISNAKWVVDPTLLLSKETYEALLPESVIKARDCFIYMLPWESIIHLRDVLKNIKKKRLSYYCVSLNNCFPLYTNLYPSVQEWLYWIQTSKYVITNSFHGTVISVILRKQFAVLLLKGSDNQMNSRIENLLDVLGLSNRIISDEKSNFNILFETIDWQNVQKKLNVLISDSKEFLKDCCDAALS